MLADYSMVVFEIDASVQQNGAELEHDTCPEYKFADEEPELKLKSERYQDRKYQESAEWEQLQLRLFVEQTVQSRLNDQFQGALEEAENEGIFPKSDIVKEVFGIGAVEVQAQREQWNDRRQDNADPHQKGSVDELHLWAKAEQVLDVVDEVNDENISVVRDWDDYEIEPEGIHANVPADLHLGQGEKHPIGKYKKQEHHRHLHHEEGLRVLESLRCTKLNLGLV